jgi:hypothetical protein
MQPAEGLTSINAAVKAVLEAGYSIILRRGPDDRTGPLIGRVVNEASEFTGLYLAGRNPPATVAERQAQAAVVGRAVEDVFRHIHHMLRADEQGG